LLPRLSHTTPSCLMPHWFHADGISIPANQRAGGPHHSTDSGGCTLIFTGEWSPSTSPSPHTPCPRRHCWSLWLLPGLLTAWAACTCTALCPHTHDALHWQTRHCTRQGDAALDWYATTANALLRDLPDAGSVAQALLGSRVPDSVRGAVWYRWLRNPSVHQVWCVACGVCGGGGGRPLDPIAYHSSASVHCGIWMIMHGAQASASAIGTWGPLSVCPSSCETPLTRRWLYLGEGGVGWSSSESTWLCPVSFSDARDIPLVHIAPSCACTAKHCRNHTPGSAGCFPGWEGGRNASSAFPHVPFPSCVHYPQPPHTHNERTPTPHTHAPHHTHPFAPGAHAASEDGPSELRATRRAPHCRRQQHRPAHSPAPSCGTTSSHCMPRSGSGSPSQGRWQIPAGRHRGGPMLTLQLVRA
jgi:hypothetical protein